MEGKPGRACGAMPATNGKKCCTVCWRAARQTEETTAGAPHAAAACRHGKAEGAAMECVVVEMRRRHAVVQYRKARGPKCGAAVMVAPHNAVACGQACHVGGRPRICVAGLTHAAAFARERAHGR